MVSRSDIQPRLLTCLFIHLKHFASLWTPGHLSDNRLYLAKRANELKLWLKSKVTHGETGTVVFSRAVA